MIKAFTLAVVTKTMLKTFCLAADIGNYEIKYWTGEWQPYAIRSVQTQLTGGTRPLRASDSSPLIEYGGKRYHLGHRAYHYRNQSHVVEGDKADISLLSTLACCNFQDLEYRLEVRTSHPTPETVGDRIQRQLLGTHRFTRNGVSYVIHIVDVTVEPEGVGAYRYAKANGLVLPRGLTLLIDIGGGTWISRLFDRDGEIIDQSSDEKGGVYKLATSIAFDDRLIQAIGTRPEPGVIMNGFANQSHYYGEMNEASWLPYLSEHLDPWFSAIKAKAYSQYQPHFQNIKRVLLTGGGSLLVQGLTKKGFVFPPEPRFANVRGLLPEAEIRQRRLAIA